MRRPPLARLISSLLAGLVITLALSTVIALRLTPRGTPTTRVTFDFEHPYGAAGWLMTVDHAGAGWTHRARSLTATQSYGIAGAHIYLALGAPQKPDAWFPIALPPRGTLADLEHEHAYRLIHDAAPSGTLLTWPLQMRTGWPARSMAFWHDGYAGWGPMVWGATPRPRRIAWGRQLGAATTPLTERVIPLEPLWPGLIINTLFWAAIILALATTLARLRHSRRRRRNQCTRCAYPLDTLPTCPECGTPSPAPTPTPANA